jgi:hypothetical protein
MPSDNVKPPCELAAADGCARARSIVGTSKGRPREDYYLTPASATEALLRVEQIDGDVWECACGCGAMSKVLESHGLPVKSTDLINRGYGETGIDFLMPHTGKSTDNIITNPPYNLAEAFVEQGLLMARKKVCLLLKLCFLEGQKRRLLFERTPLARVWVFSRRLQMGRDGRDYKNGGMIAFAWYVWEHGRTMQPTLGWIEHNEGVHRRESSPVRSHDLLAASGDDK